MPDDERRIQAYVEDIADGRYRVHVFVELDETHVVGVDYYTQEPIIERVWWPWEILDVAAEDGQHAMDAAVAQVRAKL